MKYTVNQNLLWYQSPNCLKLFLFLILFVSLWVRLNLSLFLCLLNFYPISNFPCQIPLKLTFNNFLLWKLQFLYCMDVRVSIILMAHNLFLWSSCSIINLIPPILYEFIKVRWFLVGLLPLFQSLFFHRLWVSKQLRKLGTSWSSPMLLPLNPKFENSRCSFILWSVELILLKHMCKKQKGLLINLLSYNILFQMMIWSNLL